MIIFFALLHRNTKNEIDLLYPNNGCIFFLHSADKSKGGFYVEFISDGS